MFKIISHQGNSNQNHPEIPPYAQLEWRKLAKQEQQMLVRMWWKGNPLTLLVGMHTGTATLENSMEVPQKVENRANLWPSNALLGIYHKDTNVLIWRGTCTPMFIAGMSTVAKLWKEHMSIDRWMDKEDVVDVAVLNIGVHVPLQISIFVFFR